MSLATVYKSLDAFCEIGIVRELNVGEEAFRYDADISVHPHVRCISCDKVADVPIAALSSTRQECFVCDRLPHCIAADVFLRLLSGMSEE